MVETSGSPACLITKWAAVWLVHADKTRSHVGFPTPGCDLRATANEDLDAIPKAHGGGGDYFLDQEKSTAACKLRGCGQPAATAATTAATPVVAGEIAAAAPAKPRHPLVPTLGWGAGVPAGGSWMDPSQLRFNAPAKSAFASMQLGADEPLLLVFGGASVNDMLKNWYAGYVSHVPHVHVTCSW